MGRVCSMGGGAWVELSSAAALLIVLRLRILCAFLMFLVWLFDEGVGPKWPIEGHPRRTVPKSASSLKVQRQNICMSLRCRPQSHVIAIRFQFWAAFAPVPGGSTYGSIFWPRFRYHRNDNQTVRYHCGDTGNWARKWTHNGGRK